MQNQEQFLALLRDALENIREPRFFHTERGFQGELLVQLRNRLQNAELPGEPRLVGHWRSLYNRGALAASPSSFQASNDNRQSVAQQLRIPSFRYKIGTTEGEKKRYAAP